MINQMKLDKSVKLSDKQLDEVAGGHMPWCILNCTRSRHSYRQRRRKPTYQVSKYQGQVDNRINNINHGYVDIT